MAWPLTGRARELEELRTLLADAASGGVVVTGPAGVGKTRLVAEAIGAAERGGATVAWVRATRSSAHIPLGAFAPLLPASALGGGAGSLAGARAALAEHADGRRLVLCVDDGQLLDDASAALLHQLVAGGAAQAVVTVRRGDPAPEALLALWKDELCALLELGELPRAEADALLEAALGGAVDGRSRQGLWSLTRGNALFLRELVLHGTERGLLAEDHGIWRWRGDIGAGLRVAEVVGVRLAALGPAEHALLEVVAVGAPLEAGLLTDDEAAAVAGLEARGLVERRVDGRRRWLDLAHPLHGEVVREQLPSARQDAIRLRLADAVEAHGARRSGDPMRIATWRLEAGGTADPALFERAANEAMAAVDAGLAERFARAAVRAGGGFTASLVLGRALAAAGRAEEAEAELAALRAQAHDDGQRTALAIAMARNRFWGLGRGADALRSVEEAEAAVTGQEHRDELLALRMRLVIAQGRPLELLATAEAFLHDPRVRVPARIQAAVAVTEALIASGRTADALAVVDAWLPVAVDHGADFPVAAAVLRSEGAFALRFAGRLLEATATAEAAYAATVAGASVFTTAVEVAHLGSVWLARGRTTTALRYLREGASLLRDDDAVGMLAWTLAGVAQAAAQAGDVAAARRAVTEMEARPLGHGAFAFELDLGRAWASAAQGELSAGRRHAAAAVALAHERGQWAFEVRALHELTRLGDPAAAAGRLAELTEVVEGPFAAAAAAHAAALVARDGVALRDAAELLAAQDALLAATEAAEAAAAALTAEGRAASARAAAARGALWLGLCEGARPPTLLGRAHEAELTRREREIALLAAAGATSPEIAERLVVSVRTVDNHLQRAYRKLGVGGRQELAGALHHTPVE